MPIYLVDVELPAKNGLVKDSVHNTFTVEAGAVTQGNSLDLVNCFSRFYGAHDNADLGTKLSTYIASSRTRGVAACPVRIYDITNDLGGTPHGSPVAIDAITLGGNGNNPSMPDEVALALTLRGFLWENMPVEAPDDADADLAPERPRQRRTGRVYLGPFTAVSATTDGTTGFARPSAALITTVLDSTERLMDDLFAIGGNLMVWSRANADVIDVSHFQVDDAFDTQRRRGPAPTIRHTREWNVAP